MKVTTDACLFGAWCAQKIRQQNFANVLDVGAGTGLLTLMIAQKTEASVDAVEIEPEAAGQALENLAASPWAQRTSVVHADVLQWPVLHTYECIVSNPPFYEGELLSQKDTRNLAHHSQQLSLSGLLQNLHPRLASGGRLLLLLPAKREAEIKTIFGQTGWHIHEVLYAKQTVRHQPFRLLIEAAQTSGELVKTNTLAIKDEADNYTEEFRFLLKDYYLAF